MTFEAKTYLRDVINPLRDQVGGLPATCSGTTPSIPV